MTKKKERKETLKEYDSYRMNNPDGINVIECEKFTFDESVARKIRKEIQELEKNGGGII